MSDDSDESNVIIIKKKPEITEISKEVIKEAKIESDRLSASDSSKSASLNSDKDNKIKSPHGEINIPNPPK